MEIAERKMSTREVKILYLLSKQVLGQNCMHSRTVTPPHTKQQQKKYLYIYSVMNSSNWSEPGEVGACTAQLSTDA